MGVPTTPVFWSACLVAESRSFLTARRFRHYYSLISLLLSLSSRRALRIEAYSYRCIHELVSTLILTSVDGGVPEPCVWTRPSRIDRRSDLILTNFISSHQLVIASLVGRDRPQGRRTTFMTKIRSGNPYDLARYSNGPRGHTSSSEGRK